MFGVALLPRTLKACETDLRDPRVKIRVAALVDLGRCVSAVEQDQRVQLAVSTLADQNSDVRCQALIALADLRATSAARRVFPLLADREIRVRQMAVMCLGEIAEPGDTEVLGRLDSLLRAGDASVRYQALLATSQISPHGAGADLLRALSDSDHEVRELAVRLVDEVVVARDAPVSPLLRKAVVQASTDRQPRVRLAAQLLCGELELEAPTDMILEVIARRFRVREPRDEQTALKLAGTLKLTAAMTHLERRAFGRLGFSFDPYKWSALVALAQLGDERAYLRLRRGLSSRSYVDRNMAAQSLGEVGIAAARLDLEGLSGQPSQVDPEVLTRALENLSKQAPTLPSASAPR